MQHLKYVILTIFFLSGTFTCAFAQSVWTVRNNDSSSNDLNTVTWTGSQLVAMGDGGSIYTSPNGTTWTSHNTATTNQFLSVTWTGSQLVAVGQIQQQPAGNWLPAIWTSPNGATWTLRSSGSANLLYCVTWSGSQLVAVGENGGSGGIILTSPDGITWTTRASNIPNALNSVTSAGSQLVAVGSPGKILTSPDGVTWTARNSGTTSDLMSVIWTGSQLIATSYNGTILTSSNGVTWTSRTLGTDILKSVTWTGTQIVILTQGTTLSSNNGILTSYDGITWASFGVGAYKNLLSLTWTGSLLVAVGGQYNSGGGNIILTSPQDPPAPPATPTLNSPAQNATGVSTAPNLTWTASNGAGSYRLQVSTNSGFTTTVLDDSTITTPSKTISGLSNNTLYYWRVNAKNSIGTSSYSIIRNFTTATPVIPPFPVLSAPAQNAVGTGVGSSPRLIWFASTGATSYRLQLSTNSGFTTTVLDDSTITTTYRDVGVLSLNTLYYWRVNAKNSAGTSPYSAIWNFTTSTVGILPKEIELQSLNIENNHILHFSLSQRTHVIIQLFNSQGRMISQLLDETRDAGYYTLPLNNEPPGSYYLDFRAGDYHKTLKVR